MLWQNIDDKIIPAVISTPPINVVERKPILSVKMPETGDSKNVAPSANEPTKAVNEQNN